MAGPAPPSITLTPLTCGRRTLPMSALVGGEPGDITVPVTAYLIEHPDGMAVFDSGPGPRYARLIGEVPEGRVDLDEADLIDAQLRGIGVDPVHIRYILSSHLHSDHAGGNALLPAASVIVQQTEWAGAHVAEGSRYHPPEFDTGQPIHQIIGQHDVFGDGSVVLVPTPGHTAGHQSACVQTRTGEVVLAGDACHLRRSLTELAVPDHSDDPQQYRCSLEWFRLRQRAGATIAFGHDPEFWATIPQSVPWNQHPGIRPHF